MKQLVTTSLLVLLCSISLIAQKAPMKFGKVSKEEVIQSHYPADTTVDAAILCEYGEFNSEQLNYYRRLILYDGTWSPDKFRDFYSFLRKVSSADKRKVLLLRK